MKNIENLICPVCKGELFAAGNSLKCENNHSFDLAKEDYVNLLLTSKKGSSTGDSREMAKARRDFLNKDYFSCLGDFVAKKATEFHLGTVLDICCGEGYYSQKVLNKNSCALYGFDLSREMVRLCGKRKNGGTYFVANLAKIPIKSGSIDFAFHLFAPFNEKEFARVLKNGGRILTCVPGENHLWELKQAVYDTPYKNDEKLPEVSSLKLVAIHKVSEKIHLESKEDISALFQMTPYFYRTKAEDKSKLNKLSQLECTVEFVLGEYEKPYNIQL